MKITPNIETCVYAIAIGLSLIVVLLVLFSGDQFKDVKIVYQAF